MIEDKGMTYEIHKKNVKTLQDLEEALEWFDADNRVVMHIIFRSLQPGGLWFCMNEGCYTEEQRAKVEETIQKLNKTSIIEEFFHEKLDMNVYSSQTLLIFDGIIENNTLDENDEPIPGEQKVVAWCLHPGHEPLGLKPRSL